ncbi:hypothetical protein EDC01DRAFT_438028 [Geopyxis carbonaria]|nr:hypothetical protein EDC01DRAFT_438028 [Geopyxis carbonaria]
MGERPHGSRVICIYNTRSTNLTSTQRRATQRRKLLCLPMGSCPYPLAAGGLPRMPQMMCDFAIFLGIRNSHQLAVTTIPQTAPCFHMIQLSSTTQNTPEAFDVSLPNRYLSFQIASAGRRASLPNPITASHATSLLVTGFFFFLCYFFFLFCQLILSTPKRDPSRFTVPRSRNILLRPRQQDRQGKARQS